MFQDVGCHVIVDALPHLFREKEVQLTELTLSLQVKVALLFPNSGAISQRLHTINQGIISLINSFLFVANNPRDFVNKFMF